MPAVVLGYFFSDIVDRALGEVWVIAVNLILGGVVMLFIDQVIKNNNSEVITYRHSFIIGLFQTIAMFLPGMSRSMCTIVGGMVVGVSRKGLPNSAFGRTHYVGCLLLQIIKLAKEGELSVLTAHMDNFIVGNVQNVFIVALFAIKYFIKYLQRHTFRAFGIYRIVVGGSHCTLLLLGYDLALFQ